MPRATISTATEKFELTSAPPDGYVVLKRRNYGDQLKRRDLVMLMNVKGDIGGKNTEVQSDAKSQGYGV